jgi:hypothetical protein
MRGHCAVLGALLRLAKPRQARPLILGLIRWYCCKGGRRRSACSAHASGSAATVGVRVLPFPREVIVLAVHWYLRMDCRIAILKNRRPTPITGWKLTDARPENGSRSQGHHCRARIYPTHPSRPLRAWRGETVTLRVMVVVDESALAI